VLTAVNVYGSYEVAFHVCGTQLGSAAVHLTDRGWVLWLQGRRRSLRVLWVC
jgi:hypothetical protein